MNFHLPEFVILPHSYTSIVLPFCTLPAYRSTHMLFLALYWMNNPASL
jgi:hypothetical protein